MSRKTSVQQGGFHDGAQEVKSPERGETQNLMRLIVKVIVPLGVLWVLEATSVQAALPRAKAAMVATSSPQAPRMIVIRSGRHFSSMAIPARNRRTNVTRSNGFSGSGFMNPNLMVMTSQGVMHRDAAARLGLPGTPIAGSPENPDE